MMEFEHYRCCVLLIFLTSINVSIQGDVIFRSPAPIIYAYPDVSENGTTESNSDKNDELILNKGDNFTIDCFGDYPLMLIVKRGAMKNTDPDFGDLNIEKYPVPNTTVVDRKFGSIFMVTNVDYTYTGLYTCKYTENEVSSSVYVYVKDATHLIAPHGGLPILVIQVYHYTPALLPCRTTDPSANVTLRKVQFSIQPQNQGMIIKESDAISYNPREGFILKFPNIFFQGMFECVVETDYASDKRQTYIKYLRSASIPKPYLVPIGPIEVEKGKDFNITCIVNVDKDTGIMMEWFYTSNETTPKSKIRNSSRSDRVRYTTAIRDPQQGGDIFYDKIYSVLTVMNAQKIDQGIYTCVVTTHDGKNNSKWLEVLLPDDPFISLGPCHVQYGRGRNIPTQGSVITTVGADGLTIACSLKSYPKANVTWFFRNKAITDEREYQVTVLNDIVALTVFGLRRSYAGKYILVVQSLDNVSTKTFELIVHYMPSVRILSDVTGNYFVLGETYSLRCDVDALPAPVSIIWQWQPCTLENCLEDQYAYNWSRMFINETSNAGLVTFVANECGFVQCVAVNAIGRGLNKSKVLIADRENGFGMDISRTDPIEGTSLHLKCFATRREYSSAYIYFQQKGSQERIRINTTNSTYSELNSTQHSWTSEVYIPEVQISDSGLYGCEATYLNTSEGENFVQPKLVTVQAIRKPYFLDGETGKNVKFNTDENIRFKLPECNVRGVPTPVIRWLKDGVELSEANNNTAGYIFSDNNQSLTILHTGPEHEGDYTCEAENIGGVLYGNWTLTVGELIAGASTVSLKEKKTIIIVVVVLSTVCVIVSVIVSIVLYRRRSAALHKELEQTLIQPNSDYNPELPIDEQTSCIPYDPKWEFPKKRLRQGMVLGQGAFGRVIKAEAIGIQEHEDVTIVAVKMVKDCTDRDQMMALLSELKILIHLGHHLNIVNLLGAVTKNIRFGELYVIVEFCHFGNLRSYVLKHKDDFKDVMDDYIDPVQEKKREAAKEAAASKPYYINKAQVENSADLIGPPLTTKNLICWSFQVARGMDYLVSKKYIHRDLAARNVLLAADNVVKICDFGLAKDCYKNPEYHKKGDGPVPVKWMAIESLTHRLYTSKSDVWSYGIFLWELFCLGGSPYPGIEINEKFIGILKDGYRMEKPRYASEEMYKVMQACWREDPDDRPTFTQLASIMGDFLEENVKQYYLDLNEPYLKMVDLEEGACGGKPKVEDSGYDGYFRMNGKTDYTKMSPAPPLPGQSKVGEESGDDESGYINEKKWKKKKEKGDSIELQPLTQSEENETEVILRHKKKDERSSRENSPSQLHTHADVHRHDDTDSGHSSTYAPGTSPDMGNDGYLIPKTGPDSTTVFLEPTDSSIKPKNVNKSAKLDLSDLTTDYHSTDSFPPTYSAVLQDGDINV